MSGAVINAMAASALLAVVLLAWWIPNYGLDSTGHKG
jgi:hypothetical protein